MCGVVDAFAIAFVGQAGLRAVVEEACFDCEILCMIDVSKGALLKFQVRDDVVQS